MPKRFLQQALLRFLLFSLLFALIEYTAGRSWGAPPQQGPPPTAPALFADVIDTAAVSAGPEVLRQRPVTIDWSFFPAADELQSAAQRGSEPLALTLNFFPDVTMPVQLQRSAQLVNSGASWVGQVADTPLSDVVMIIRDQQITANIYTPQGHFQIRPLDNGLHLVRQIDPARFPFAHDDGIRAPASTDASATAAAMTDSGALVDVMVLYVPNARLAAGSKAAIESRIELAVAQANQIYANSRITPRLRLVYAGEVNYNTSGNLRVDLERLTATNDGTVDEIHALRDRYRADLVSLWVESGDMCGMGWIRSMATSAFSVVDRSCAESTVTFAHELGHNFGARHDWYVDSYVDNPTYNKGYVNLAQRWVSVMAYFDHCAAAGIGCRSILYFSNPDVLYNGVATGVRAGTSTACRAGNLANPACDAENYRVHNERALTVANFRAGYTYADLWVEQRDLADPVNAGAEVTYQVTVSNVGVQAAPNVVLTDQLPSGVRFVRASHPGGACPVSNGVVTCTLGTMGVRSNVVVTLVVATDTQTPTRITNLATVSTTAQEERTTNNSASEQTQVRSPNGNNTLFLSTASNVKLAGVTYSDEDIFAYDLFNRRWQLIFDGSDVGITGDVDGFAWQPDGSLLLSFDKPLTVNGVGPVDDSDIVRFVPTALGAKTTGRFSLFLDGSTVDLTTDGEDIDAIALTPAGELVISIFANGKVGALTVRDTDLLVLRNGRWELYLFGVRADLTSTTEDIGGAWIDPQNGEIYLATAGSFIVPGVSGVGGDIFLCQPTALGATTACTYREFWRSSEGGLVGKGIDGIEIGPMPSGVTITAATPEEEEEIWPEEAADEEEDEEDDEEEDGDAAREQRELIFLPLIHR